MVITYASDRYGSQELGHLRFLPMTGWGLAVALEFTISIWFSRQIFRLVGEITRDVRVILPAWKKTDGQSVKTMYFDANPNP
ncbi:hypothetical protein WJU16_23185 [Chitinophaga pollutisoli]|uniref:Uncharacterized protein n=1 Tax=Chitinophaga pollutisoli TaxID=3133966 RepID=A0ABZ2YPN1_9BACT